MFYIKSYIGHLDSKLHENAPNLQELIYYINRNEVHKYSVVNYE